jgi:hypothetical protein
MTKLVLCPHFVAHVKSTDTTESVPVVCTECGPKRWHATPTDEKDGSVDPDFLAYAQHVREELIPCERGVIGAGEK